MGQLPNNEVPQNRRASGIPMDETKGVSAAFKKIVVIDGEQFEVPGKPFAKPKEKGD